MKKKLSNNSLLELKRDCFKIIDVINNLITVISDKTMITVDENQLLDYKIQFIEECAKLEGNLSILKKEKYDIKDLIDKYNELNNRINNAEFLALIDPKEIKKAVLKRAENQAIDKALNEIDDDGIKREDVQVVNVNSKLFNFMRFGISFITGIIITFVLMFAFSGFFSWGKWDSITSLIFFILYYCGIEGVFKILINLLLPNYVMKTFGFGLFVATFIAMIIAMAFPIFLEITNYLSLFFVCVLSYALHAFIVRYVLRKVVESKFLKK